MRLLLVSFVILVVACGSAGNPLADTEWQLVSLGEAGTPALEEGGVPTASFTATADMMGWTGCNSYSAKYSVRGAELLLEDLLWTEIACPSQELFQQEKQVQDSLVAVKRFEVSEGRLTLLGEAGQLLVFERAEE